MTKRTVDLHPGAVLIATSVLCGAVLLGCDMSHKPPETLGQSQDSPLPYRIGQQMYYDNYYCVDGHVYLIVRGASVTVYDQVGKPKECK